MITNKLQLADMPSAACLLATWVAARLVGATRLSACSYFQITMIVGVWVHVWSGQHSW